MQIVTFKYFTSKYSLAAQNIYRKTVGKRAPLNPASIKEYNCEKTHRALLNDGLYLYFATDQFTILYEIIWIYEFICFDLLIQVCK